LSPAYEPLPSGFEASARLTGTDPAELSFDTGLQLTRQFWGWMLSQDPGSTFWEKATTTGTPNIGQFESLAHGWASGPTVTLTSQVLGVTPTSAGYASYSVIPHPADLAWTQGSVPTPHGGLQVSWNSYPSSFGLKITSPAGTNGEAGIPTFGRQVRVTVDGHLAWDAGKSVGYQAHSDGTFVYVEGLKPGRHVVTGHFITAPATAVEVDAAPVTLNGSPGTTAHVAVTVTGLAAGKLSGTLAVSAPAGWTAEPGSVPVSLDADGRVVSADADIQLRLPGTAQSGDYPIRFTFTGGGTTVTATATMHVSRAAVGSTTPWSMHFQVDDVGYTS
jgi:hypothetical protein